MALLVEACFWTMALISTGSVMYYAATEVKNIRNN